MGLGYFLGAFGNFRGALLAFGSFVTGSYLKAINSYRLLLFVGLRGSYELWVAFHRFSSRFG